MGVSTVSEIAVSVSVVVGAGIGTVASAIINARSHRDQSASAIVQAASQLTDRLLRRNADLADMERAIRDCLLKLSDAVSAALYEHPHCSDATMDRLREANHAAQGLL